MPSVLTWGPVGKGPYTEIDWASLPSRATVDAYVCWHEFTDRRWKQSGAKKLLTRLIVELHRPLDAAGLTHLNNFGLWVTPHFTMPLTASRYITAICVGAAALKKVCKAVLKGDTWIARYEVSEGFSNPDAFLLSIDPKFPQPWDKLGAPRQLSGPVVGFIDYGCAFLNQQFRAENGSLRIDALWDQQEENKLPPPPKSRNPLAWQASTRYAYGREVDGTALATYADQFKSSSGLVDEATCYRFAQYEPVLRAATHGTHVMDVATGHPDPLRHRDPHTPAEDPLGAAIAFVQLPRYRGGVQVSGLLKAQVLDAVHFLASLRATGKPAFINLSYGSYCGPHDGSSIIECAIDDLIARSFEGGGAPLLHVVVPSGNASELACHAQVLVGSLQRQTIMWFNLPDDPSESFVELWAPSTSKIRVRVTPPGVSASTSDWSEAGRALRLDNNGKTVAMLIHAGNPCQTQSNGGQMVLLATRSTGGSAAAPHGSWQIEVENAGSSPVIIDAWCERDDPVFGTEGGPRQAHFETHIERTGTLNSIAHGRRTVVVGGYDVHSGSTVQLPGPVSVVSSSGPGRGLSGRLRHPPDSSGAAKNGPEVMAPCDLGLGDPGLPGAAVLSGDQTRLMGTSVAAAAYTRWLVKRALSPPPSPSKGPSPVVCPPTPPSRDPHPDDCEPIPRIP